MYANCLNNKRTLHKHMPIWAFGVVVINTTMYEALLQQHQLYIEPNNNTSPKSTHISTYYVC
jgi:hypothetical protein